MSIVFFASVILKGVGAVLEVLLQITITRATGLAGYGRYSALVNSSELVFWLFFSGLVKCNTFYLSQTGNGFGRFRRRYYLYYALPVCAAVCAVLAAAGKMELCVIVPICAAQLLTMDFSSTLMAQGRGIQALFGEYVLGRAVLLAAAAVFLLRDGVTIGVLTAAYLGQYLLVILYLRMYKPPETRDISETVSLKKWAQFQRGDIVQALISQMPVILQYFFAGAFEAGVVSVVLLVKKLINFISGPTAKVFLPEFSRLHRRGDTEGIRNSFSGIMRVQMLFAGPLAVVLVGFPRVVLRILVQELVSYEGLFVMCSAVFLTAATLGPCGGVMQMTGNEKADNHLREGAVLAMIAVFALFRRDTFFVLYGLCAQTAIEAGGKYLFVCRWMKRAPVSLLAYMKWWLVPAAVIALSRGFRLSGSFRWMLAGTAVVLAEGVIRELHQGELAAQLRDALKKRG